LFDPHPLLFLINFAAESGNGNKFFNGMKMDIDRHGARLMANNCQHPGPPYFSLPSTFKIQHQSEFHNSQLLFFATNWPQNIKVTDLITINVPVVFMARYIMILRGATSLRGALEGVGPENRDFFGP
jgi:hypothetical protein